LVGVLAGNGPEDAEGRGDGVASPFDREFDDVLGVEVSWGRCEGGARGVLDTLIDGEDGNVPGTGEPAVVQDGLEAPEHLYRAVGRVQDAGDEGVSRKVEGMTRERPRFVLE